MTPLLIIFITIILFALELAYFKIASYYNVIDIPNKRSSHTGHTVRGGGIIFVIAAVIHYIFFGLEYSYFTLGLLIIATISFIDDIVTLNNKLRLAMHLVAVILLFIQWDALGIHWVALIIPSVFIIGTINAYNFMDGINGITGFYSLATIATLFYINEFVVLFIEPELLIVIALGLITFNFFNFRNKARCFAGDVGSVGIAYILIFSLGCLILKTGNLVYILTLLVYGLDAISTIIFRLIRQENIFEAHRSHFYQYLANEKQYSHLYVAMCYTFSQVLINTILIRFNLGLIMAVGLLMITSICFILLRFCLEGSARLLNRSVSKV